VFQPGSRYAALSVKTIVIAGGDGEPRTARYVERRLLPPPEALATLLEHRVGPAERVDRLAARVLGDPLQFWRIVDANRVTWPDELTELGRVIRIALSLP